MTIEHYNQITRYMKFDLVTNTYRLRDSIGIKFLDILLEGASLTPIPTLEPSPKLSLLSNSNLTDHITIDSILTTRG